MIFYEQEVSNPIYFVLGSFPSNHDVEDASASELNSINEYSTEQTPIFLRITNVRT